MKKLLIFALGIVTFISFTSNSKSQQAWKHQLNPELGYAIPYGSFADAIDLNGSFGLGLTYYFQFLENRQLFFSASVSHYFNYEIGLEFAGTIEDKYMSLTPITLGARYNFTLSGFQPYVGLEVGYFLLSTTIDDNTEDESYPGIIPKVGFRYPIVKQIDLDVNIKAPFVFISDYSTARDEDLFQHIGLNVGVAYTIGKNPLSK